MRQSALSNDLTLDCPPTNPHPLGHPLTHTQCTLHPFHPIRARPAPATHCRAVTVKGVKKEWGEIHTFDARTHSGVLDMTVYACEGRVRAHNVASLQPSEWSEVVALGSEKEEEERSKLDKSHYLNRMEQVMAARAAQQLEASTEKTHVEQGTLVVSHTDFGELDATAPACSPFAAAVGAFYRHVGVPGG